MNTKKDYYRILDVDKRCDFNTLKDNYRKLSKKLHPDLNNGETVDIFADINEAYSVLSNIEQRLKYDTSSMYGANYDLKNELYNYDFSNKNTQYDEIKKQFDKFQKDNIDILLEINDFKDLANVTYERRIPCDGCNGYGIDLNGILFDCDACGASGNIDGLLCSICLGVGQIGLSKCNTCNGTRTNVVNCELSIKRSDFEDNKLKIKNYGNCSKTDVNIYGNLYIRVREEK